MITTKRTTLVEASISVLRALVAGDRGEASALLGITIPDDYPGNSDASAGLAIHLAELERDSAELPWRVRFIIVDGVVIGSINLKGPPGRRGDVEIGWGLIETMRRRGYATEASLGVIDWAFATGRVQRVIATIPPDHDRSQQVALRLGMEPTYELKNELPVWARARTAPS